MPDKAGCPHFGEREPVANDEHLAALRQGTEAWNKWRDRNPWVVPDLEEADVSGVDLSSANLSGANLSRANLSGADLSGADLRKASLFRAEMGSAILTAANLRDAHLQTAQLVHANLRGADLTGARLNLANLTEADLAKACFTGANLLETVFVMANLNETNFSGAHLAYTVFHLCDLTKALGLEECQHVGPSIIDPLTLSIWGDLPISFLRGCGLPEPFIEYLPSLRGDAIKFYSCFISYSARDQIFGAPRRSTLLSRAKSSRGSKGLVM